MSPHETTQSFQAHAPGALATGSFDQMVAMALQAGKERRQRRRATESGEALPAPPPMAPATSTPSGENTEVDIDLWSHRPSDEMGDLIRSVSSVERFHVALAAITAMTPSTRQTVPLLFLTGRLMALRDTTALPVNLKRVLQACEGFRARQRAAVLNKVVHACQHLAPGIGAVVLQIARAETENLDPVDRHALLGLIDSIQTLLAAQAQHAPAH